MSAYFCRKTICVSSAVREALVRDYRFPAGKTITIYNGVSVSKFVPSESGRAVVRARLGVSSDEFLLVCTARLSEVKRVDILFQAMALVMNRIRAVVGPGLRNRVSQASAVRPA